MKKLAVKKRICMLVGFFLFIVIIWQSRFLNFQEHTELSIRNQKQIENTYSSFLVEKKATPVREQRVRALSNDRRSMSLLDKFKRDLMKGIKERFDDKMYFLTQNLDLRPEDYMQLRKFFREKEKRYKRLLDVYESEGEILYMIEKQEELYEIINFKGLDLKLESLLDACELGRYFLAEEEIKERNIKSDTDRKSDELFNLLELSVKQQEQIRAVWRADIVKQYNKKPPITLLMYNIYGEKDSRNYGLGFEDLNSYLVAKEISSSEMGLFINRNKVLSNEEQRGVEERVSDFLIWQVSKFNQILTKQQSYHYMKYLGEEYKSLFRVEVNIEGFDN